MTHPTLTLKFETDDAIHKWLEEGPFPRQIGEKLLFAWKGEADAVRLRCWIHGLDESMPFTRHEDSDLWTYVLELPRASRVEYKLEIERDTKVRWIRDPRNPELARDPFGANSVCQAKGYESPHWVEHDPNARPGRLVQRRIKSQTFGKQRRVQIYLPARFSEKRKYPLLIVHDGGDYLKYAALGTVLDNLIHRLEIPPMIVALTNSSDRLVEYAADARHAEWIATELLPALKKRYPIREEPESLGLMGASFGGVATLHTAWMYPGIFGRLCMQSGSFGFTDIGTHHRGPVFDPVVKFVNAFREEPRVPSEKVFLSCGMYESLIYENRSIVPKLQETGMDVRFVESRDGHNWENWRDRLQDGLAWLFPGPLWIIYE